MVTYLTIDLGWIMLVKKDPDELFIAYGTWIELELNSLGMARISTTYIFIRWIVRMTTNVAYFGRDDAWFTLVPKFHGPKATGCKGGSGERHGGMGGREMALGNCKDGLAQDGTEEWEVHKGSHRGGVMATMGCATMPLMYRT